MSLSKLSAAEVEEYLENYKWHRPAREERNWRYEKTGNIIPEHWVSIAEGNASWDEWWGALDSKDFVDVENVGRVFLEHQFGGEGQGDQYYIVLRIEDYVGDYWVAGANQPPVTTRYFKKNGWYASHDGGYLDGSFDEVKPVVKPVTFWE